MATVFGDFTHKKDGLRADGGVHPEVAFAVTKSTHFVGGFVPGTLTTGTDVTGVDGTVYFGELFLPASKIIKGCGYLIGSVGGTDKAIVALYNSAGVLLANSATAGTTVGSSGGVQELDFTAQYAAVGPALYYVSVSVNGTTCRLRHGVVNGVRGGNAAGVFGTLAAITPPTAAAAYPIAYIY